ncbi:olfactory marker protein a isoform X1 [Melanotaenia boesemani]|uniref:olfactory marker protein a isoform X1 n=1 Tax=Melanotaenia boesemani TaxID=1250792 RepID=UPI001C03D69D|nr:olfactory marker protein a isoform X1 [Melanotaenia boesemani]
MADVKLKVRWTSEMENKLVELWEERECLFNVSAKSYHSRNDKDKSWQEIASAMQLSVEEVRGRATTLRTQYSKLLKSKASGSEEKALTAKQTWMLKSLSFLKTYVIQRTTSLPTSMKNTLATEELPCSDQDEAPEWSEDSERLTSASSGSSTPLTSHTLEPSKKRKKIQSTDAIELEKIKILQQMSRTLKNRSRPAADADTTFGVQVTSELKLITDPVVKTRVKRRIMTALYEAQELFLQSSWPWN